MQFIFFYALLFAFDTISIVENGCAFKVQTSCRFMVGVAQVVEHRVVAPVVEGSNPFTHPIFKRP